MVIYDLYMDIDCGENAVFVQLMAAVCSRGVLCAGNPLRWCRKGEPLEVHGVPGGGSRGFLCFPAKLKQPLSKNHASLELVSHDRLAFP